MIYSITQNRSCFQIEHASSIPFFISLARIPRFSGFSGVVGEVGHIFGMTPLLNFSFCEMQIVLGIQLTFFYNYSEYSVVEDSSI
jgi:hypothetical protein